MSEEILGQCMMCKKDLTEKNVVCCWDTGCQNASDMGEYCEDCYPYHRQALHGDKI